MNSLEVVLKQFKKDYAVRQATIDDAQQVAALMNTCSQLLIGLDERDAGELMADWGDPQFDLDHNSLMVFAGEKLIAYSKFWGIMPPYVRNSYLVRVHPEYRGLGVGMLLNRWAEAKARIYMQNAPIDLKVILTCIINRKDEGARQLMAAFGSKIVRNTWVMEADLTQEI
jgi:GNAT superfamily N-acetyltransferase